jgi:acyl homoserine lactone synthase
MGVEGNFFGNRAWEYVFPELVPQEELSITKLQADARRDRRNNRKTQAVAGMASPSQLNAQVRATTLSMLNMHNHGELFINFMRARREIFIHEKGWVLPEVDGMEFDQYDTPRARWIVLHEYGEVLGGVRLSPTTSQCGQYSYMIRDAQNGLITTIPQDVLFFKAPVRDDIWEATRLFLSASIPAQRRTELQKMLLQHMGASASALGATHVIGIVPAVFSRWMTRLGVMSAVPVGPVHNIEGEKTQAALMNVSQY